MAKNISQSAIAEEKETGRVEAFSDGVFAIAMTLLILEIKVPHLTHDTHESKWQLFSALMQLWPSFVAFLLSFGTVLIMWVSHHGLFKHARGVDNRLMFANGLLLLLVTFVPFPTAVLAEYLDTPQARAAAVFYCAIYVVISISYNLLLWSIVANRRECGSPADVAAIRRIRAAYRLGMAVYFGATIISIVSSTAGLAICFSLWPLWILLRYVPDRPARDAQ